MATANQSLATTASVPRSTKAIVLLCCVVSVLTAGLAAKASENGAAAGRVSESAPTQVIHLADGTKLTLLGVTVGTRQMAPQYQNLRRANWLYTPINTAVVWIEAEHDPKNWPNYALLVSDRANTACVSLDKDTASHVKDGVDVQGFVLSAFPRRDQEMVLRAKPYGGAVSLEQFVIPNPVPVSVAGWAPEPLPATKSDGNLEVTLTKLLAGASMPYTEGREHPPANDPANQCVRLDFSFRENGQSTTNWQPWPVQTSDATGNHVRGLIQDYPANGIYPSYPDRVHPSFPLVYDGYFFQPGLWPDEAAWKVRLEFIRKSGFSDDEMVTFTNLPVRPGSQQDYDDEWTWEPGKTNFAFVARAKVNGVELKLLPPLPAPNRFQTNQKFISVIIFADADPTPQGMKLTVLEATDEQGHELPHPFSPSWAGHFGIELPNPGEVKSLNLRLALHKSRFVEFTVKPAKP